MRAVALLGFWKLRNSFRTLLSDPRKLIPAALILLLFGCSFLPFLLVGSTPRSHPFSQSVDPILLHAAISLVTILIGLSILNTGLGDNLLAFAMPDVDYLFPSPISRRVVLAYRLPALTFGGVMSCGIIVVMFTMFSKMFGLVVPHMGNTESTIWLPLTAIGLCVGGYLNLALFVAVQFRNRTLSHRILSGLILALLGGLGIAAWQLGIGEAVRIIESPWLGWVLLPSHLAADALFAGLSHLPADKPLEWLALFYGLSLIPLLTTTANYYEASIVSTERVAAIRQAAKGGYGAMMAAKAASAKRKSFRPYTIAPFGQGAVALFWAHLCSAAKKPVATFVMPPLIGIVVGVAGAEVNQIAPGAGFGVVGFAAFYASAIFMTGGKTASEAAVRRRELISPLPIPAWQAVVANLGVPWLVSLLFGLGAGLAYAVTGGTQWPMVAFGFAFFIPLRLAVHTTLQYGLVIGYADLADKVQQILGSFVYYLFAGPIVVVEVLICIPAMFLHSIWLALLVLTIFQLPMLALTLTVVGRASARAAASGEPVTMLAAMRR